MTITSWATNLGMTCGKYGGALGTQGTEYAGTIERKQSYPLSNLPVEGFLASGQATANL